MSAWDDLMQALQQKMYSNPYVQGQQPPSQTLGQVASSPAPQMGGMAGTAQLDLQLHPMYLKYALSQQEQGQQSIPYDQWKAAILQQAQQGQPQQ